MFLNGETVTYYVEVTKTVLFDPFFRSFLPLMRDNGIGVSIYICDGSSRIHDYDFCEEPQKFTGLSFEHKITINSYVKELDICFMTEYYYPVR